MKLRAGVIGAGVFGGHHARKYQADGRVELVGVYDLDSERMEALTDTLGIRAFPTMEALLDLVDVVTVASPPATHAEAAEAALARGKHVLVEKPLATSVEAGSRLVALAAEKRCVLACGHQERLVFEAMGLLGAPEQPLRIESVREGPWTGRSADVSVTLDLMVHDLDLALQLMRRKPERVLANGRAEHGRAADALDARLAFGGAEAVLVSSRVAGARRRFMRAVYPSGEVNIDFLARTFDNTTNFPLNSGFAETRIGSDPLGANVSAFIDAAFGLAPRPAVTGAEALAVLDLALEIDAAAGLPSLN